MFVKRSLARHEGLAWRIMFVLEKPRAYRARVSVHSECRLRGGWCGVGLSFFVCPFGVSDIIVKDGELFRRARARLECTATCVWKSLR